MMILDASSLLILPLAFQKPYSMFLAKYAVPLPVAVHPLSINTHLLKALSRPFLLLPQELIKYYHVINTFN